MNTFNLLSMLSSLLEDASSSSPVTLRESNEIDRVLAEQQANAKKGGRNFEPIDLQIQAVKHFWTSRHLDSLKDARLVSFGLTVCPWGDSRCIIEDRPLFEDVLAGVSTWRDSPRQFRKCYQGLLRSYFDYDVELTAVQPIGKENWKILRDYLKHNINFIKDTSINPDWVDSVLENQNLFTSNPCVAYGNEVLEGNTERAGKIRQLLGISDGSWFTRELVMAQLIQATRRDDQSFASLVSRLLRLIENNDVLRNTGLKLILDRYASIVQPPEHIGLKEQAVAWWGNPWLPSNQDSWGGVSPEARDMISNWLSDEFITLFFTKLAQDGLGDTRRVLFWKKYITSIRQHIPSIRPMQFALGSHARKSKEKDFVELRKKLNGLLIDLDDANSYNNAFIMQLGDLLAVEFSGESNAFYGYSLKHTLPFNLTQPVKSGPVDGINSLKSSCKELYLRHQDGVHGYAYWEDRFEDQLQWKFGIRPGEEKTRKIIGNDYIVSSPKATPAIYSASAPVNLEREESIGISPRQATTFKTEGFTENLFSWVPREEKGGQSVIVPSSDIGRQEAPTKAASTFVNQPVSEIRVTETTAPQAVFPNLPSEVFNELNMKKIAESVGGFIDDNRAKGGALWIRATIYNPNASRILQSWGFTYKVGKGWWKAPKE